MRTSVHQQGCRNFKNQKKYFPRKSSQKQKNKNESRGTSPFCAQMGSNVAHKRASKSSCQKRRRESFKAGISSSLRTSDLAEPGAWKGGLRIQQNPNGAAARTRSRAPPRARTLLLPTKTLYFPRMGRDCEWPVLVPLLLKLNIPPSEHDCGKTCSNLRFCTDHRKFALHERDEADPAQWLVKNVAERAAIMKVLAEHEAQREVNSKQQNSHRQNVAGAAQR